MDRSRNGGRRKATRYVSGSKLVAHRSGTARAKQRAVCVGVQRPLTHAISSTEGEWVLDELAELLHTAGVATIGELIQRRRQPDPDTYLGLGKMRELKATVERLDANLVACDDELSPRQERNLEQHVGVPVLDRTAIILDIFADHANSAEGKLQVELAQLQYNMARMRGLWTHLERLGGGIGTRGPGESQIETDRRLARDRIKSLSDKLERQERRRKLMRSERESSALPTVALAGYTNAGKSTLMNALSVTDVPVAERLFHTLDPTTRAYRHNGRAYVVTDTVGFISKLPHQLVDAFAATMEETRTADLVVHVVDASYQFEEIEQRIQVVASVLDDIGATDRPVLLAFNKCDKNEGGLDELRMRFPDAAFISAREGSGVDKLKEKVAKTCGRDWTRVDLLVPYDQGSVVNELHKVAGDLKREERPDGVAVTVRLSDTLAKKYRRFAAAPKAGE